MNEIILLSGSPSEESRTDLVLKYIGRLIESEGFSTTHISVRDIPAEILVQGQYESPEMKHIGNQLQQARGVIIGSPVYKASFSGVLKALVDLLPQDVLKDTPVYPLMVGGTMTHLLALEYALKPLVATLKGKNEAGVFLLDKQVNKAYPQQPISDDESFNRITTQLNHFIREIHQQGIVTS